MKRVLRKIKDMKYRHKLTILLVTASLVPMVILVLYNNHQMREILRKNEMEDLHFMLEQSRESVESQVQIYRGLLDYLAFSPDLQEIIEDSGLNSYQTYEKYTDVVDPLLSIPKSYHTEINQVVLYAQSIPVRHGYTLAPLKKMEEEWWSQYLGEKERVQWIVDKDQGEIAAVRRINDYNELSAVLCVTLDYEKFLQPFRNMVSENSGAAMIDAGGRVFFSYENISPEYREKNEKKTLLETIRKDYAYVSSQMESTGWNFYLYKPHKVISRSVSRLLMDEVPLILLVVVIVGFIGFGFSRIFTRRIEQLTRNMDQVNHGSRKVTVTSDSNDEIGILIRSFRHMMAEINRLIKEVYENKIALKEFEMKALQAQINPHFLYNSLSIINWMAIRGNNPEISKVTLSLSTFYRTALSRGEDMVPVESCVKNIEAYLDIQLVMHDHDFQVRWEIDQEVKNEKVPKLILQPVVENALEHGLDPKEEGEKILWIQVAQDDRDVIFTVRDNGEGMEPDKVEQLITYQTTGYGLKNVNDRICLLYGEDYRIQVNSTLGLGTSVRIKIPKEGTAHEKKDHFIYSDCV